MTTPEKRLTHLRDIIEHAERSVQKLIADAAQVGDYGAVDFGRHAAMELCGLRERLTQNADNVMLLQSARSEPRKQDSGFSQRVSGQNVNAESSIESTFEIQGTHLLKIGWSKKKKEKYVHKVAKATFDRVIATLANMAATQDGPVAAERLIKTLSSDELDPIPSYQVYVVIGFLRDRDVVQQCGREGYTVPSGLKARARDFWPN